MRAAWLLANGIAIHEAVLHGWCVVSPYGTMPPVIDQDGVYEIRYGWNSTTTKAVVACAVFVLAGLIPGIWTGRVRVDGILMPAGFLPVMRTVDFVFFGGGLLFVVWRALSRKVILRVDGNGVTLAGGQPISWAGIRTIELFTRAVSAGRRTVNQRHVAIYRPAGVEQAAGLSYKLRRTMSTAEGQLIGGVRSLHGLNFDQAAFTAAVGRFAPQVNVVVDPHYVAV